MANWCKNMRQFKPSPMQDLVKAEQTRCSVCETSSPIKLAYFHLAVICMNGWDEEEM